MCGFCDFRKDSCKIFIDSITNKTYLAHPLRGWSWINEKIFIDYCPWCGRRLVNSMGYRPNSIYVEGIPPTGSDAPDA